MKHASIGFIDCFALMLIILFLLPMKPDVAADENSQTGMVVVEAHWPQNARTDVDLWVRGPGDEPVGYSRLRGDSFSLFRDDLGADVSTPWRYEVAAARSIMDGEYIVNLHLFSDFGNNAPILVRVVAWYRRERGAQRMIVWDGTLTLRHQGEEQTAVRWAMLGGNLTPGSLHHSPIGLRSSVPLQ